MGYWGTETSPVMSLGVAAQDIVWASPPVVIVLLHGCADEILSSNSEQAQPGMWFKEQAALKDRGVSIW